MDIKYMLPSLCLVTSSCVFADISTMHGFINSPPSRAFLCSAAGGGLNQRCGQVQYEPQSVEGRKGFPEEGPSDGKIASGGNPNFDVLNEQSPTRWYHPSVNSGVSFFSWTLTAAHSTTSWRFFITKPNWDPNKPLVRSDFDLKPFCEQFDNGNVPTNNINIKCNIPERNGYQVILGVWDIADTGNAFYQVIDANMVDSGNGNGNSGDIADKNYLDSIKLSKVQKESDSYVSYNMEAQSDVTASSTPEYRWTLPKNAEQVVNSGNHSQFIINKKDDVQVERVRVKVTVGKASKVLIQDINIPGLNQEHMYDYIFPDNFRSYTAGTIVYQPADKKRYECRTFPYSGYCVQWSPSANQFEPGVGSDWKAAWILLD